MTRLVDFTISKCITSAQNSTIKLKGEQQIDRIYWQTQITIICYLQPQITKATFLESLVNSYKPIRKIQTAQ